MFYLLEVSDESDHLAEEISQLGARTLKNYTEWVKSIKELNIPVDLKWQSSYRPLSKISFDAEKANRIHSVLSNFSDTTESEVDIKGKLMGANVRTKSFEILTEQGEKITGRIGNAALNDVSDMGLNVDCEAELLKVTVIGPANMEKVSWTLKSISKEQAQ